MTALARRSWVAKPIEDYVHEIAAATGRDPAKAVDARLHALIDENRRIHEDACVNLNPGDQCDEPEGGGGLASGLGSRPSLGYPGDKYEMGLEAIEKIEVIAAELAAEMFGAKYAEIRVGLGRAWPISMPSWRRRSPAIAIIAPPAASAGISRITRRARRGSTASTSIRRPDASGYTVDITKLAEQARALKPSLITIGCSLNLFPHPIRELRKIADEVGASLLFDAAHMSGMIAGHAWQQPLEEGAHLMTMSTYKRPGWTAVRPRGDQRTRARETARRHRLPGAHRQFRRGEIRVPRDHASRLEGARASLCGDDGEDGLGARAKLAERGPAGPCAERGCTTSASVRDRGGAASVAASGSPKRCGAPIFWPAASACRSPRSKAT